MDVSSIIAAVLAVLSGFFNMWQPAVAYIADVGAPPAQARIIFGGDMMFDRSIRKAMGEKGVDFNFSCIAPTLAEADLVVANLEGPITGNPSVSLNSKPGDDMNFTFTFPTSTAELLYRHNIRMVSLGNNHMLNFSLAGLRETKAWLKSASVGYFGDPEESEDNRVARIQIHGVPFSFVNWSDWTSDKTDHTVAQVAKEKAAERVVVVYTHWGDEYVPPPERVRALAHEFVNAGADIVIGSHPHIIQEHEVYAGKNIYYSLGNFIFDQYWEDSVRRGLLLSVVFGKNGVESVTEIPVQLERNRRTCPVR